MPVHANKKYYNISGQFVILKKCHFTFTCFRHRMLGGILCNYTEMGAVTETILFIKITDVDKSASDLYLLLTNWNHLF